MQHTLATPDRTLLPIEMLASPFVRFARMKAASGLLLFGSAVAAMVIANSRWGDLYHALWSRELTIQIASLTLTASFHAWLNDCLMSIFFFLVGLEIKREILVGELSSLRQAAFPFAAAIGGTVVPALCYLLLAHGTEIAHGWGVPMATDIAFALGVLSVLGHHAAPSVKVFVTALAIVDDIVAVLVIAIFYSSHVSVPSLIAGLLGVALAFGANLLGIRRPSVYTILGAGIWVAMLRSGVHATVAGVLLALTIPARTYLPRAAFLVRTRRLLDIYEQSAPSSFEADAALHTLETEITLVKPPLHRIEEALEPWVSFLIMPLFAFANAGVHIEGPLLASMLEPVFLAVVFGLVVGKPLGVWLFAWLATKAGWAERPRGTSWASIFGASCLCGLGFTMALFIATLAFGPGHLLDSAKMGAMGASAIAGIVGATILVRLNATSDHRPAASA